MSEITAESLIRHREEHALLRALESAIYREEGFSDSFGACCESCARGKICESKRDSFGGLTVSSQEIAELDGKIQNLTTDIQTAAETDPSNPDRAVAFANVLSFRTRWMLWRDKHVSTLEQSAIPFIGEPNVGVEFQSWQSQYNEILRQWIAKGEQTTATEDKSEGPLGGVGESIGSGLKILGAVLLGVLVVKALSK